MTLPPAPLSSSLAPFSSFSPSSSYSSDRPKVGVNQIVPPIICEEEKKREDDMASNLRVEFRERQRKLLSKSVVVNSTPSTKACPKPVLVPKDDTNVGAMPTRLSLFSFSRVR